MSIYKCSFFPKSANAEHERGHFNFDDMEQNADHEGRLAVPEVLTDSQVLIGSNHSPPSCDLRPPAPRGLVPPTSGTNETSPGGSPLPPSPFLDFASAVTSLMQQVNLMVERERTQKYLGE